MGARSNLCVACGSVVPQNIALSPFLLISSKGALASMGEQLLGLPIQLLQLTVHRAPVRSEFLLPDDFQYGRLTQVFIYVNVHTNEPCCSPPSVAYARLCANDCCVGSKPQSGRPAGGSLCLVFVLRKCGIPVSRRWPRRWLYPFGKNFCV